MVTLILFLSTFLFQEQLPEKPFCSCRENGTTICGNLHSDGLNFLGEILEFTNNYEEIYTIKILDSVDSIFNGDTITVYGQNGLNCVTERGVGLAGDTVFMGTFPYFQNSYVLGFCGNYALNFKNDSLRGLISPEVNVMTYPDFKTKFEDCLNALGNQRISGSLEDWKTGERLEYRNISINGYSIQTQRRGWFEFNYGTENLSGGIEPLLFEMEENSVAEGLSVLDLIQIQRHLLGQKVFEYPQQIIAADVDLSGEITAKDLLYIQQVLLGRKNEFPLGISHLIYSVDYEFPKTAPFWTFSESNKLNISSPFFAVGQELKAIKLGDVAGGI